MAELAKQLAKLQNVKVLICTQSNSAADLFIEKMKDYFSPKELFRLYAFNRSPNTVPSSCMSYTLYKEGNSFYLFLSIILIIICNLLLNIIIIIIIYCYYYYNNFYLLSVLFIIVVIVIIYYITVNYYLLLYLFYLP